MKRWMLIAALVLTMLMGVAAADGWVAPAELTEAEFAILELMGHDTDASIFDYEAPAEANAVCMKTWELSDGHWQLRTEDMFHFWDERPAGRIAVRSGECLAYDLFVAVSGVYGASYAAYEEEPEFDQFSFCWVKDVMYEHTQLPMAVDLPLVLQAFCMDEELASAELSAFAAPELLAGYDHAYAVTVAFIHYEEAEEAWNEDDMSDEAAVQSMLEQLLDQLLD